MTYIDIKCIEVDYANRQQTDALLALLQMYARDPMGGGAPIAKEIEHKLIDEMAKRPHVFSVLVYGSAQGDVPSSEPTNKDAIAIGFANCIESFSTFKGRPVVNIHDFAVLPEARGQGVSQALVAAIEIISTNRGACKLTLEVLEGNLSAQQAYLKAGFSGYELDPELGRALFWEKKLQ
jgi:GNAT superfamily N-acetyltransferase